ncbi:MAG: hypothetical protein E7473_04490 [Ruminococcaceae bacterium]|nr:hypothetical protein [Oscillospiraceae bacterium]
MEHIVPTGVTKKDYLDLMERVFDSYGVELLEKTLSLPDEIYHFTAFRTSVMIAYLIESGRRPELLSLWEKVTEKCVRALRNTPNSAYRKNGYNDLTLEELCISFMLMKEYVKPEWLDALKRATPETHYSFLTKDKTNNMMVYGLVGMYLRHKLTGEPYEEHFDMIMPWVLERLDENGMYDDDDHALLYDITTRVRFEQLLWFGYDGKWAKQIDEKLRLSGEMTLKMQSAAFQIPYGGRSNQFLHNEALQTSLCEYEANRWKKLGDAEKAGRFKRAAHLSFLTIGRYLELPGREKHIRNKFSKDCLFGIDHYGTFPRYMNVLSTFIACGYMAADDTIEERMCPAEKGGYVIQTSERFGKVFASAAGQSVEYAILADPSHEASGLGRYHKSGAPAELGLSMPFTEKHSYLLSRNSIPLEVLGSNPVVGEFEKYVTDNVSSRFLAISPGYVDKNGEKHLFCESETPFNVKVLEESSERVSFSVEWKSGKEEISLDADGLHLSCKLCEGACGKAFWAVPLLSFNGSEKTEFEVCGNSISANLDGFKNVVSSSAGIVLSDEECGNRNGIYRIAYVMSETTECNATMVLKQ